MKQFPLRFLAADRVFYEGPCESLMVPLTDGLYGVQADHTDMMGAIIAGEAILRIPSGEKFNGDTLVQVIVGRGLVKIEKGEVLVLVDTAELPTEIDEMRAMAAKERAERLLAEKDPKTDIVRAETALLRAMARITVKK